MASLAPHQDAPHLYMNSVSLFIIVGDHLWTFSLQLLVL